MPRNSTEQIQLRYGSGQEILFELESSRVTALHVAPPAVNVGEELATALTSPIDFPPLRESVFPDDKVVLALEQEVAELPGFLSGIWKEMAAASIQPADVLILQPDRGNADRSCDPRLDLPEDIRKAMRWRVHSHDENDACGYLASSASSERVYLSRELLDADVVLTAGRMSFDSVLGYRGTNSIFFPGLSNAEAAERARGEGHRELGPDDERPLRSLIDEIGWLLGTQFTIQVLPGEAEHAAAILAGANESVLRRGKRLLNDKWRVQINSRSDVVIAAIDGRAGGDGWHQLGAAVDAARNIVSRGGRIVVLSDFNGELGEGMRLLRDSREPSDALQPLRGISPSDMLPAMQIASAADWAGLYLLSGLESDVVEELFITPLSHHREVERLIGGKADCAFLESAQFVAASVTS